MGLDLKRPIIIRKIKKIGHAHAGGVWKLAYADFVTAMMAFFLLMWLLGSTTDAQRHGIAEYFENPYRVSLSGGKTSGDTISVLTGGGPDISKSSGQINRGDSQDAMSLRHAGESDQESLEELNHDLRQAIEYSPLLHEFRDQLKIDFTRDGLRIQLVDNQRRPMFSLGSEQLEPYAERILAQLAPLIAKLPNKITIIGHTDATPYAGNNRNYSNWELSTRRANAARRAMLTAGLPEDQTIRVSGMAATLPFDPEHPRAPVNRRIAIIVLNKRTEHVLLSNAGHQAAELQSLQTAPRQADPPAPSTGNSHQTGASDAGGTGSAAVPASP
ncbi:MAG TPA: flagellar motor protein MotB [Nitrococcus sp.]|nr:flagellar motor protein MotB [Nitrococcus sp.]